MVRGFPKLQWGKNGKNNLVREVMKMGKKKRKREKRKRNRIKKKHFLDRSETDSALNLVMVATG